MSCASGSMDHRSCPVPAADLEAVARTFAASGAVHVRGAVDPDAIASVRAAAESVYARRDGVANQDNLPEVMSLHHQRRFVSLDDLELGFPIVQLLGSCFRQVGRQYLGHDPQLYAHSHVRWISSLRNDLHLPFHQDQTIEGKILLNVWIPLTPCGSDAPGLQVIRGSWVDLLKVSPLPGAHFAADKARIDEALIGHTFATSAFWNPEFDVGDAMIFSGATAHRTHVLPGMRRNRMSLELRFV